MAAQTLPLASAVLDALLIELEMEKLKRERQTLQCEREARLRRAADARVAQLEREIAQARAPAGSEGRDDVPGA